MNPFEKDKAEPNYWLSCILIDSGAMAETARTDQKAVWTTEPGKSSPTEILEALAAFQAEGRPIWKPMHMQPIYRNNAFITRKGSGRATSNAYTAIADAEDVGADIFNRGLCLPSDNKMTTEQQDTIIEIIHRCFQ